MCVYAGGPQPALSTGSEHGGAAIANRAPERGAAGVALGRDAGRVRRRGDGLCAHARRPSGRDTGADYSAGGSGRADIDAHRHTDRDTGADGSAHRGRWGGGRTDSDGHRNAHLNAHPDRGPCRNTRTDGDLNSSRNT